MSQIKLTNRNEIINFYSNYLSESIINHNILLDSISAHTPKMFNQIDWNNQVDEITLNNYGDDIQIFIKDITNIDNIYSNKPIDLLTIVVTKYNSEYVNLYNLLQSNWNDILNN